MAKINYDGTNIVGAPYKDYVDQQIKVRQEKLGKLNKNNEDIAWGNAKSGFVALASSINIGNSFFTKETTTYNPPVVDLTLGGQDTTGAASGMQGSNNSPMGQEMRATLAYLAETDPFYSDYNNQGYSSEEIEAAARDAGGFTTSQEVVENNDGERRVKLLDLVGDPQDFFGNRLAREMVLYGGTAYYSEPLSNYTTPEFKFGVTKNTNAFDSSVYGYGGTDEGLKPMPGITSFNIKSKNMGSLREATITIRANSEEQFKMIDNLYCRIGYTMFVEWGNSLYFDNEGKYQSQASTPTTLIPIFLKGKVKYEGREEIDLTKNPTQFINLIETFREFSDGNYDAFFGRVKNFSWEYNAKEQYYEINLSLISWGDIIESLTVDAQYGSDVNVKSSSGEVTENTSALETFLSIVATPKGQLDIYKNEDGEVSKKVYSTKVQKGIEAGKITLTNPTNVYSNNVLESSNEAGNTIPELNYTRLSTSVGKIVSNFAQFGNKNYYYVRFGDILDFIRDQLLLYSPTGFNEPIMDIDTDTDKNIMYYPGINVSADPTKVMISALLPYSQDELRGMINEEEDEWTHFIRMRSAFYTQQNENTSKLEIFPSTKDPNTGESGFPLHGKIMNIYFEFNYLMNTIKGLRNETTTKIPLFDFLSQLCDTANSCLGGVNKLSIRLENDRIIKIYDQNPIYGTQALDNDENTVLNLTGFRSTAAFDEPGEIVSNGSFVTDVSIKTELTNDFSTTVSVGAQAQDKTVGEDATGLSTWNYGLIDRYYPSKIDGLQKNKSQDQPTLQERILKIRSQLKFLWLGYAEGKLSKFQFLPVEPRGLFDIIDPVAVEEALKVTPNGITVDNLLETALKLKFEHFPIDRAEDFVKLQKDWLSTLIKQENEIKNVEAAKSGREIYGTNQIGMIPINIQITMDGLSGIRIYDKLTVDTRFLPSYYPQTLYWIIKGVSHEINNNKWYTKLETIAVPKLREDQDLQGLLAFENVPVNTESFAREDVPDFVSGDSGITYSMAELTTTSTGLDNTPTPEVNAALQALNTNILQPITIAFGKIGITSGYRSPAVNTAIGGSTTSQHMKGQAVDFTKVQSGRPLSEVFEFIATKLNFDQAIWEKGDDGNPRWIHVSYNNSPGAKQRGKLLRFFGNGRYLNCNAQGEV